MVNDNLAIADEDMTAKFHVIYDGEALNEHLMDVRDLAPAMMAVSDLLTHANQEINGDNLKVELKVKANFKAGSFGIEFVEVMTWYKQVVDILSGQEFTAIANAGALIGIIGLFKGPRNGLIQLYKYLKGNPPLKIEEDLDGGVKVFYEETDFILVEKRVLQLYRSQTIASDISKMLEPLKKEGIDSFYVVKDSDKDNVEVMIDESEVEYFHYQDFDDSINYEISETFLQIESISFKESNKWKFSNGSIIFNAQILDANFLERIDNGDLRFGKGDILKVQLRTSQYIVHNKLKTEYQVIKVIEHRAIKAEQGKFDI
ncbi:hypothetical protein JDA50_11840 [Acinetobacter pittii]|uniref:Uncharacterized protein n=1 Tax=Acinetobacter pittii TaxID=48296 RepID=A0A8I1H6E9_ACIPI|nr:MULTISPECIES: hypothetical protein [Acinetobacter calcoaceticus/baumannii complex]MBF9205413.1 hypothetical protein [Acinetobacter pittii]MBK1445114.1 hypothetical protein [Acinetobacter pittii]MBN6533559.1 hypothetical protein [Acinetobacter pittii]MBQ5177005.1 hypothetical protein [Acinetobacter pittii]MBW8294125.1 hypothetical protein [Acinetobacter pittii]